MAVKKILLRKGNVVIRGYSPSDLAPMVSQFSHPVIQRNIFGVSRKYTKKDARSFLRKYANKKVPEGDGHRFEYAIEVGGEYAGGIGVTISGHKSEIGYWLGQPWWSKGIMTRVVREFSRHLFSQRKLQRIEAKVFPFNSASIQVLRKNGFQYEGRLRKNHAAKGKYLDDLIFSKVKK